MDYEQFITIVEQEAGEQIAAADAVAAARSTLQTLGERIDREEARQLAAQLPPELAPWIATTTPAERFDVYEFVRRVGMRENVPPALAQRHISAVFDALARAVSGKEWNDVVAELPRSFAPLLPRGPHVEVADLDTFLNEVSERTGISLEDAERATDAVLETLAERIAGGEVEDLIVRLPVELLPPLERGRANAQGQAKRMSLEQFIDAIAHREGVGSADAVLHARAVLQVLRDAVGELEFLDVTDQLPDDYLRVLAQ